jgi:integrase/recombinase XerD
VSFHFVGPLARDMEEFVAFKRSLGYRYTRSELTLRAFDRFLVGPARRMRLKAAILAWLRRPPARPPRKPASIGNYFATIYQFCLFRRRRDPKAFVPDHSWAPQITSTYVPHVFSPSEIRQMLRQAAKPPGPTSRSLCPEPLVRMLILTFYCTGIRLGEAVGLRIVDIERGVLQVESKGRARWVPFHSSLNREFRRYLRWRRQLGPADSSAPLFLDCHGKALTVKRASEAIRSVLRAAGLKSKKGRVGPRPYDLRHTFACHRLARWYRAGVDVQSRLPWLSAYMGHVDLCGTEKYLHGTGALLGMASRRFYRRFAKP